MIIYSIHPKKINIQEKSRGPRGDFVAHDSCSTLVDFHWTVADAGSPFSLLQSILAGFHPVHLLQTGLTPKLKLKKKV